MLKIVPARVWAFDVEWVPDPASGRRVYKLPESLDDKDVLQHMWREGGATEDNPQPYLKTVLCRVVSIAALIRERQNDGTISLKLHSLPSAEMIDPTEADILRRFLTALGKAKPQLVGYNSWASDIPILLQRSLANKLSLPEFCKRPAKPWEGVDYFARGSDFNIDLKEDFAGWGKATPSLHELATVCRIPGKLGTDGQDVITLWLQSETRKIIQYNECDALTTYLLWLRAALLAGHIAPDDFLQEETQLETLLTERALQPENIHLQEYLNAWKQLKDG
jgi:3'-5' exonuclease